MELIKYQISSDHVPCKSSRAGGALPHTDTDWTSRMWAMSKPDGLKRRASVGALSRESLDSLEPLETNASCFRNCALQRVPVRWTLALKPTIWRSPRPCQSRNITEQRTQRLQRRASPVPPTSNFQIYHVFPNESHRRNPNQPRGFPKQDRSNAWKTTCEMRQRFPEQRVETNLKQQPA